MILSGLALATAVALLPILIYPLPPLADYANHLARMHVIATIGADPDLSRFYDVHWQAIPNLIMDIIVPPLEPVVGIYRAGQIFTVVSFVLIASGIIAFNRVLFGRCSVVVLAALPLFYNRVFFVGVMNYWFGIGLALWALAVWVLLRERPLAWRLMASTAFVIALFFSHLVAVGVYGIALLAFEFLRLWKRRDKSLPFRLIDFAASGLPFIPIVALLLVSPTWNLSGKNYWWLYGKLEGLYFVISTYSNFVDFGLAAGIVILAALAAWRGALRIHPVGWTILGVGAIVYLAMPNVMFDTYMVDERLPIAIVFLIIACTTLELQSRLARVGAVAALFFMLVVRVIEVAVNWAGLSHQTTELLSSIKLIEQRGSRVLVAQLNEAGTDEVRTYALGHAACLAIIERSAFVANAFVFPGKQIMQVRPEYRRQAETRDGDLPSVEQLRIAAVKRTSAAFGENEPYWQQWQNNFDYLFVMFTDKGATNPLPELLTLVYKGERFQLYKIR